MRRSGQAMISRRLGKKKVLKDRQVAEVELPVQGTVGGQWQLGPHVINTIQP